MKMVRGNLSQWKIAPKHLFRENQQRGNLNSHHGEQMNSEQNKHSFPHSRRQFFSFSPIKIYAEKGEKLFSVGKGKSFSELRLIVNTQAN